MAIDEKIIRGVRTEVDPSTKSALGGPARRVRSKRQPRLSQAGRTASILSVAEGVREDQAARLVREQAATRELAGQQSPASILRKGKIKAGERTTGLGEIRAIRREATQAASVAADAPYNREKQLDRELTRYVTDAEARAKVAASRGAGADAAELEADSESDLQESRQLWTTEENIEKHDNLVEIIELQRDAAEGLADDASTARLDELKETASADMDALRFEAAEAEKSVDKTIAMEKYKAILKMTTEIAKSDTIFPQEKDKDTGDPIGATPEEQVGARV